MAKEKLFAESVQIVFVIFVEKIGKIIIFVNKDRISMSLWSKFRVGRALEIYNISLVVINKYLTAAIALNQLNGTNVVAIFAIVEVLV